VITQQTLIERVWRMCAEDDRLDAALMYGSFASGEGDEHSDIEFWLFFDHTPDPLSWCSAVAPVSHLVVNEFGAHVAFFPGLIRGEFHFATTADISGIAGWPARGAAVENMLIADRGGRLAPVLHALPARPVLPSAEDLHGRFVNWLVLAHHVIARGEHLRGWDALGHVRRHLLWLLRLAEGSTGHWLTPSRNAEAELPAHRLAALRESASPAAALRAAWLAGRDLVASSVSAAFLGELDRLLLTRK
jgi:lincosamide nucleotidyltransferase